MAVRRSLYVDHHGHTTPTPPPLPLPPPPPAPSLSPSLPPGRVFSENGAEWRVRPKLFGVYIPMELPFLIADLAADYSWVIIGYPSRKYLWIMTREQVAGKELYADLEVRVVVRTYTCTLAGGAGGGGAGGGGGGASITWAGCPGPLTSVCTHLHLLTRPTVCSSALSSRHWCSLALSCACAPTATAATTTPPPPPLRRCRSDGQSAWDMTLPTSRRCRRGHQMWRTSRRCRVPEEPDSACGCGCLSVPSPNGGDDDNKTTTTTATDLCIPSNLRPNK
jgi:hypothetical protein